MDDEFNRLYYKLEAFHLQAANPIFFNAIVTSLNSGNIDPSILNARLINRVLALGDTGEMPDVSQMAKTVQKYLDKHQ